MRGSVLCLPTAIFLWNAQTPQDITPGKLAVLAAAKPKIEMVVLGTGPHLRWLHPAIDAYFMQRGIRVEQQSTVRLASCTCRWRCVSASHALLRSQMRSRRLIY